MAFIFSLLSRGCCIHSCKRAWKESIGSRLDQFVVAHWLSFSYHQGRDVTISGMSINVECSSAAYIVLRKYIRNVVLFLQRRIWMYESDFPRPWRMMAAVTLIE